MQTIEQRREYCREKSKRWYLKNRHRFLLTDLQKKISEEKRRKKISMSLKEQYKSGKRIAWMKGKTPWNKKEKICKTCVICNKIFYTIPYHKESDKKLCSMKCKLQYMKKIIPWNKQDKIKKVCRICNKEYFILKSLEETNKYCSWKCSAYSKRGRVAWNRGKEYEFQSENWKIRHSHKYKLWRKAVYIRDNWTCQNCGKHGGKIEAHHIKPFSQYPELRTSIENGVTLCIPCHKLTDSYGGKGYTRKYYNKKLTKHYFNKIITCSSS